MMTQKNTRFGLVSSFDLYRKLKHDANALLRQRPETDEEKIIEEYEAFNFFVTAWHLHKDWLGNATISKPEHSCEKITIAHPALMEVRHAMRDIANGSKHITLTEEPKISVGEREISSFDSYFFGAQYPIETRKHHFLMIEFVYLILEYFEWIFDDNAPKVVPESIMKKLKTAKELRIARDNITAAGPPGNS